MKLAIDYDFCNAIKDINEPLNLFKILRNEILRYFIISPISISLVSSICRHYNYNYDYRFIMSVLIFLYGQRIFTDVSAELLFKRVNENNLDSYADLAMIRLKKLVLLLEKINVRTNYEMLLESELYSKKFEIVHNDSVIPSLVNKKYISVPSYSYNGDIIETSILQEHIIGTRDYILSVDEPDKQYKKLLVESQ